MKYTFYSPYHPLRLVLIGYLFMPVSAFADSSDLIIDLDLSTLSTSNVFLDKSNEWGTVIQPSLELALDFANYWSIGYNGQLNAYLQHDSLHSHWHELYLFVNPAWGKHGQHEMVLEVFLEMLRNQEEYRVLNLVQPSFLAKLTIEPESWFRYQLSGQLSFRWFQYDRSSNSMDAWLSGSTSFTLPTKTTLTPQLSYGIRLYPYQDAVVQENDRDDQIKLRLHASQALWKQAGLQLDYTYLWALGKSGLLERKLTQAQFTYLGEEFLFSGYVVVLGFKQNFRKNTSAGCSVRLERRTYTGWKAIDPDGILKNNDRADRRLIPRAYLNVNWSSKTSQSNPPAWQFGLGLDYRYLLQQSNSDWYDTHAHQVMLSFWSSL